MYSKLKNALKSLNQEYKTGLFDPILEDDVVTRIYHRILSNNGSLRTKVFVKTRILLNIPELRPNNKYDLVIGKRKSDRNKVWVEPKLVSEFKVFPVGFGPQQLSRRRNHAIEDIKKLDEISRYCKKQVKLVLCLFDSIGWLKGFNRGDNITRLQKLVNFRNRTNRSIKIIGVLATDKNPRNAKFEEL